jgi:hypothetical protein
VVCGVVLTYSSYKGINPLERELLRGVMGVAPRGTPRLFVGLDSKGVAGRLGARHVAVENGHGVVAEDTDDCDGDFAADRHLLCALPLVAPGTSRIN